MCGRDGFWRRFVIVIQQPAASGGDEELTAAGLAVFVQQPDPVQGLHDLTDLAGWVSVEGVLLRQLAAGPPLGEVFQQLQCQRWQPVAEFDARRTGVTPIFYDPYSFGLMQNIEERIDRLRR